jgi:hypothetical protein
VAGADEEEARPVLDSVEVRREGGAGEGGAVSLAVRTPWGPDGRPRPSFFRRLLHLGSSARLRTDLDVTVPPGAVLEIAGGRGNVTVRRVRGDLVVRRETGDVEVDATGGSVRVSVRRGDVSVSDAAGDVEARTRKGEIEIRRVAGDFLASSAEGAIYVYDIGGGGTAESVTGRVLVEECAGDVRVATAGGDVDVIRVGADLSVSTRSGAIGVSAEAPREVRYDLVSETGDVDLAVAGDAGARIEASTRTGSIQCFLPVEIESVKLNALRAVAGGGGSVFRLRSESGDLRISRTD